MSSVLNFVSTFMQLKRNSQALTLLMKHLKVQEALPEDITDVDEARKKGNDFSMLLFIGVEFIFLDLADRLSCSPFSSMHCKVFQK